MADTALDPDSSEAAAALLGIRTSIDELATAPTWQVPSGDLATLLRELERASQVLESARLARRRGRRTRRRVDRRRRIDWA